MLFAASIPITDLPLGTISYNGQNAYQGRPSSLWLLSGRSYLSLYPFRPPPAPPYPFGVWWGGFFFFLHLSPPPPPPPPPAAPFPPPPPLKEVGGVNKLSGSLSKWEIYRIHFSATLYIKIAKHMSRLHDNFLETGLEKYSIS